MIVRVGYFFIMVSLIVLFAFVASYQVDTPNYSLLLVGLGFIFFGIIIVIKNRQRPEKAERFRLVRRMRSKNKDNQE